MPLSVWLLLKWSSIMTHHQGHIKVVMVMQALQILVRARTKAGRDEGWEESSSHKRTDWVTQVSVPVPQSHQGVLMEVRCCFLVVSGDCRLGHAQWLHTISAGVVSDVVVELVSCYHPSGDGEGPWSTQGQRLRIKSSLMCLPFLFWLDRMSMWKSLWINGCNLRLVQILLYSYIWSPAGNWLLILNMSKSTCCEESYDQDLDVDRWWRPEAETLMHHDSNLQGFCTVNCETQPRQQECFLI